MYDHLKLENQLCFPLYACAKEVVRLYKPYLDGIGLTYTQYITMMVLWDEGTISVKDLGGRLFLDTGTLTPLLKKLERKGLITRERDHRDERSVIVGVTDDGMSMRDSAHGIPKSIGSCIPLTPEESYTLYGILQNMLGTMRR